MERDQELRRFGLVGERAFEVRECVDRPLEPGLVELADHRVELDAAIGVGLACRRANEQRDQQLPALGLAIQPRQVPRGELVHGSDLEDPLVGLDRAGRLAEMLVGDRGEMEQRRDARFRVVGQRDALVEQVDAFAPATAGFQSCLERVEHAWLGGVDRLRASPCFDRAIGAIQSIGFDLPELE